MWGNYGLTPEQAERGGLNPKMFNSFLDGSKPSIESTAVANATGLTVPSNGLLYPPASVEDIPFVTRPISEGGVLERKGMVEVISSLEANGRKIPYDIRMGVWVTVEGETEYIRNCFEEYNAHTDPSGRYFTLYKRWHLIGLEVGMSVASVALRGEATGVATCWNADVVATAKRDLQPGELLDGEGGYTVWGKLLPAETSTRIGGLPLGLAHDVKVVRAVKKGQSLSWSDVAMDTSTAGLQDAARDGSAVRRAAPEDGVIDLVFRDALVVDGRGGEPFRGDVAVDHGRIVAVGPRLDVDAARTIAADGLALMPGIIDSHTHFDAQITWDPTLSPSPALGVTTAVIGNCGFTIAPCRPADRELTMRNLTQVEGMSIDALRAGIDWGFETFGEYMAQLRARGSVANVAAYVGHSSRAHLRDGRRRGAARGERRRDRADAGDRPRRDGARRRRLRQQHQPGAQRRRRPADAVAAGERRRDGGARRRDGRRRPRRLHADQGRAHARSRSSNRSPPRPAGR